MAGKKDKAVVAVISGLTSRQAAQLTQEIISAKGKYGGSSTGTIVTRKKDDVGKMIQTGWKKAIATKTTGAD